MKNKFWFCWVLIIYFGFAFDTYCQEQGKVLKFTLKEAQEYAVQNGYAIKNGKYDLLTAKKRVTETVAMGLPQISGKIAYQNIFKVPELAFGGSKVFSPDIFNQNSDKYQGELPISKGSDLKNFYIDNYPIPLGVKENTTFSVTATQLIFSGEYIVGLQATKVYLNLSEQALKKSESDIKEIVSKTYYQVLVTEKLKDIIKSNLDIMAKMVNDNKEMFKAGMIEETNVDQLQINKIDLDNKLTTIERSIDVLKKLLKFQMGIEIDRSIELSDQIDNFLLESVIINPVSQGFKVGDYIDAKLMLTQEKASYILLRQQQSKFLPSVYGAYIYQRQAKEPVFNFTPKNIVSLSVDIPIFSSSMRTVKVQQAKLQYEKSKMSRLQTEQGIELDFNQTNNDFQSAADRLKNLKENQVLSKKIYDRTLLKYNEGVASSFELTQAQSQYLMSEMNYYSTLIEFLGYKTKLDKYLSQN